MANQVYEQQIEILTQVRQFLQNFNEDNQEKLSIYGKFLEQLELEGLDHTTLDRLTEYKEETQQQLTQLISLIDDEHIKYIEQMIQYLEEVPR